MHLSCSPLAKSHDPFQAAGLYSGKRGRLSIIVVNRLWQDSQHPRNPFAVKCCNHTVPPFFFTVVKMADVDAKFSGTISSPSIIML